jgi:hypothetical protein
MIAVLAKGDAHSIPLDMRFREPVVTIAVGDEFPMNSG